MTTSTSGHLESNGGIRGHSAGDFFPYRVEVLGKLDALKYWVISPDGIALDYFLTSADACVAARHFLGLWSKG